MNTASQPSTEFNTTIVPLQRHVVTTASVGSHVRSAQGQLRKAKRPLLLAAALLLGGSSSAWGQTNANMPAAGTTQQAAPAAPDPLGPDLFIAIREGKVADVKSLLAKGAKTEAANWLGLTPLIWAAGLGDKSACEALIDAGADVNASSRAGNVLAFAEMGGNPAVVRLMLARGAKIGAERPDKISPLMTAAGSGHNETLRLLLTLKGIAVNAADETGATALIHAAHRGQTDAARLLLDAGADINFADKRGRTALMYAAQNGYSACTALLLSRRAQVNRQDKQGDTALRLAARYAAEPNVTRALLRAGARNDGKAIARRSASQVALVRESHPVGALPTGADTRKAAARGLSLIERSTKTFSGRAACVSCHHQGLGLMTTGLARERGWGYDQALALAQKNLVIDSDEGMKDAVQGVIAHLETAKYVPGVDMGELAPAVAFSYSGLLAHGQKPGEVQQSITAILAGQQDAEGKWGFVLHREPMQSSVFATTALTIRLLKTYLSADRAAEGAQRIEKARRWLLATQPTTNEDKSWRLLGLKWADAAPEAIAKATTDLLHAQRSDGGWAQLPASRAGKDGGDGAFTRSDAYGTGQALYALHIGGGMPVTAQAYQRGVRYLVRTQDEDGSWLVTKRAVPVNTYLDAGFPHAESQYASYNASCWATMALLLAAPSPQPTGDVAQAVVTRKGDLK